MLIVGFQSTTAESMLEKTIHDLFRMTTVVGENNEVLYLKKI
jgi:hypothetical protein